MLAILNPMTLEVQDGRFPNPIDSVPYNYRLASEMTQRRVGPEDPPSLHFSIRSRWAGGKRGRGAREEGEGQRYGTR